MEARRHNALIRGEKSLKEINTEKEITIMEKRQQIWRSTPKDRTTYDFINVVGRDVTNLGKKATQLVTGHGNFNGYLERFKLKETTGMCLCDMGREDVNHIVLVDRVAARGELYPPTISTRTADREKIKTINAWAEEIIEDEDVDEPA